MVHFKNFITMMGSLKESGQFYLFAFCLLLIINWGQNVSAQHYQTFKSSIAYKERYLAESSYNSCKDPLVKSSKVSATSEVANRGASNAVLWGDSVWTAEKSDFNQALLINLGSEKNVTGIATQGRANSNEYVIEYRIQYGSNGVDWTDYKEVDGLAKIFRGNTDGDYIVRNDFEHPIIAHWIRINPTKWQDRISLRVELYGCNYKPDVIHFNGAAILRRDLSLHPVTSLREFFHFRFKTSKENGILIYSRGTQGDYLAIQLVENRLLLNINLGGRLETSMALGSMLDDNTFHEVIISREKRDIILSVDRVRIRDKICGEFLKLNLDRTFYIGGVPTIEEGLVVYDNFTGCIENMFINFAKVSPAFNDPFGYKDNFNSYEVIGGVVRGCLVDHTTLPVTFKNDKAFVKFSLGQEGAETFNVSLEFRTYEENGLLVYHSFSASDGFLSLSISEGRIKVRISATGMPKVELDNFDQTYNDGRWHFVELALSKNYALLKADNDRAETRRILEISTGNDVMIGGGIYGQKGFIGCLKQITIDGDYKPPSDWTSQEYSSRDDIAFDSCLAVDRCTPNPCEHGGVCKQNSEEFYCECEGTGYSGAVCHISLNFMSCVHYHNTHPDSQYAETIIDIDGSGPLSPFPVRCEFFPDGRNITYVGHANEEATKVDGFEDKGSFQQTIYYDATMEMMEALINRSVSCEQKLGYDCKRSRLLNTPVEDNDKFSPYGYWVSRQNKVMDYWAGSVPGSFKCECGLLGVCFDPDKWCNCDSGHDDWLYDGGEIVEKNYLPVRALHFGDTGTPLDRKEGRYSLGPLECDGDVLFDNTITFRKEDAVIELPTFEMGQSADIYFEFKTPKSNKKMVLLHSFGESGDFIMVSLVDGNKIQFEYDSGKGPQGVTVKAGERRLDDNQWHSVLIERNIKEAMVVVDRLTKGQIKEPSGPSRRMILTSKMFVGATNDYRSGFVGCLRALVLNGVPVDLVGEATRDHLGLYGISVGCSGKCSQNPCLNGGRCVEGYDHFTCDCHSTPFKGTICADEIGVNMGTNNMIKYDFQGNHKTTLTEKIHVGFTTTEPKGFLVGAYSEISREYLTLMITKVGHLKLVLDFGFGRQELDYSDQDLRTGQFHDVSIERYDQGRKLKMVVDNHEPKVFNFDKFLSSQDDFYFNNIQYLYIGRNETMRDGFVGCISRVEFNEIIPLRLLFQEGDPISNIRASPETMTENFCGVEPITLPPEEEETRPPPSIGEGDMENFYHAANSALLGTTLSIIFIGLVISAVLVGKYLNRQKGEYVTREDEGANDAFDADTAVLQGRTGHQVERKKEWFI